VYKIYNTVWELIMAAALFLAVYHLHKDWFLVQEIINSLFY